MRIHYILIIVVVLLVVSLMFLGYINPVEAASTTPSQSPAAVPKPLNLKILP